MAIFFDIINKEQLFAQPWIDFPQLERNHVGIWFQQQKHPTHPGPLWLDRLIPTGANLGLRCFEITQFSRNIEITHQPRYHCWIGWIRRRCFFGWGWWVPTWQRYIYNFPREGVDSYPHPWEKRNISSSNVTFNGIYVCSQQGMSSKDTKEHSLLVLKGCHLREKRFNWRFNP